MKQIVLTICVVSTLSLSLLADPGDVLVGYEKALWQVATYQHTDPAENPFDDGVMPVILANMAAMPIGYVANADIEEWTGWVRITLVQAFPNNIFPKAVYNALVYSVDYYQYGTPQIGADHAAPTCTAGAGQITCEEDPTGLNRTPIVWRQVNGDFVEQDPASAGYTTELAAGTWTISPLPAVGNVIIAWDDCTADGCTSFPTFKMTVTAP